MKRSQSISHSLQFGAFFGWLLSLSALALHAQIVNGDFSSGKAYFSSDYTFDSHASIIPGYFTIQTNSHGANYRYAQFGDHTTGTGKMMLVDGHTNANQVVWAQTVNTVTNTPYLFSAWATSADSISPAVLRFSVNDIQVGSNFHLSVAAGHWQRFVGVWNSGSNTTATLSIIDTNLVYVGNDFALDDLSFKALTNRVAEVAIYPAVEIAWNATAGNLYQVQYSTALDTNQWFNVGAPIESNGSAISLLGTTREEPQRFYRVLPLK